MGSFKDEMAEANEPKTAYFKIKEGENRIRILAEPQLVISRFKYGICYEGAPYCEEANLPEGEKLQRKWKTWVIDRADGVMKLYDMPYSISKFVGTFMNTEDYGFDKFPAPYDITITAKGAGTKEVEYTVTPARKNTELTEAEEKALADKDPIQMIIEGMKKRAEEGAIPF
jgi:hypothetical protein